MSFHEAHKRAQALGFGLSYEAGRDRWHVLRGYEVVHVAADVDDAIGFCEAWVAHVR